MLVLVALRDTTKGVDIRNVIDSVLSESIPVECMAKLVSVAKDRATEMQRSHSGVIALIMKDYN